MGLFDRFSTLLRSNINDLISRAEDPEKMLNQILVDMRSQLAKAKQQVATAIADEKRLRDQADAEYRQAQDWEQKAMLAIKEGRDDLAKQALMRQGEHGSHAQQLEQTWETHRMETEKLKNSLRDLNDKIEEAKRKKNLLVARQRRAQAQARIAETMSSMSEKSAFDAFARMEERIETNERQLKASIEIEEEFTGDRLQQDFKALEKGAASGTVDSQLLALKQKMGMLPAGTSGRRAIGAGAGNEEEVHAEIENLGSEKKEPLTAEALRGARFRFAPILTATVLTVLGIWLFKTVAQVFVLLMLGVLLSLYLGSIANWIERKTRVPEGVSLAAAIFGSLALLTLLLWSLAPPVIEQTRKLVADMPKFIASWETGIDGLAAKFPALRDVVGAPGEHRTVHALYEQMSGFAGTIPTKIFEFVHAAINIFAVGVMGIYLSLHPALYREWLIALFPPIHRDLVRDVLHDLADSLRAYIVGQILAMTFLGILTAIGLKALNVPFWLPFGIFTGLVAIIPFFGTLMSTTLPALFVLTGTGYMGFSPLGHAFLVVGLGVVVHLVEGNIVAPLVMSKKVDLPPVLTILSVLVIGQLLGPLGLIIAVPTLATLMVIVRRILITRIYEGQGFRRTARERPLLLRVPAPGGGVLAHPGAPIDMISAAERDGMKRSA